MKGPKTSKQQMLLSYFEKLYQGMACSSLRVDQIKGSIQAIERPEFVNEVFLICISRSNIKVAKCIIDLQPKAINHIGLDSNSALHLAVMSEDIRLVEWLINQKGICVNALNGQNKMPIDLVTGSENIRRILLLKTMFPKMKEPILEDHLNALFIKYMCGKVNSPLHDASAFRTGQQTRAQKVKKAEKPKIADRDHWGKAQVKTFMQLVFKQEKSDKEESTQWLLSNHRCVFFEYLLKADEPNDFRYMSSLTWIYHDDLDSLILKKSKEWLLLKGRCAGFLKSLLIHSDHGLIVSWASGDALAFIEYAIKTTDDMHDIKLILGLDQPFIERLTSVLVKSELVIEDLIKLLNWVGSVNTDLISAILSQLYARREAYSIENIDQLMASHAFNKCLGNTQGELWSQCLQIIRHIPGLKALVSGEAKMLQSALSHPGDQVECDNQKMVYFHRLWVKFYRCELTQIERQALESMSDIWLIHEDGDVLRSVLKRLDEQPLIQYHDNMSLFIEKYPHWAAPMAHYTGMKICYEAMVHLRTDPLLHQCLFYYFQSIKSTLLPDCMHISNDLWESSAIKIPSQIGDIFVLMMNKWAASELEPVFHMSDLGQCAVSWEFEARLDRSMKKKLSGEYRLEAVQYEEALKRVIQVTGAKRDLSMSSEVTVNEIAKGRYQLTCQMGVGSYMALLLESGLEKVFNPLMLKSETRTMRDWLVRKDVPGFLSAAQESRIFYGGDYADLFWSLYVGASQAQRLSIVKKMSIFFSSIDQLTLDQVFSQVLAHIKVTCEGLIEQDGAKCTQLKNTGLQEGCQLSDCIQYMVEVFNQVPTEGLSIALEPDDIVFLSDLYIKAVLKHDFSEKRAMMMNQLGQVWSQAFSQYLISALRRSSEDSILLLWDIAIANGIRLKEITVSNWQYIAEHRGGREGFSAQLLEELLIQCVFDKASSEERMQIVENQLSLSRADTLVKLAGLDEEIYQHVIKQVDRGRVHISPKKLSPLKKERESNDVVGVAHVASVARHRSPFRELWPNPTPRKTTAQASGCDQKINQLIIQMHQAIARPQLMVDLARRSIICQYLWQVATLLGDRHPLRHRIIHQHMVSVVEEESIGHMIGIIKELTDYVNRGMISQKPIVIPTGHLPEIGDLTDECSGVGHVQILILYLGEILFHKGDSCVCDDSKRIRELRNMLAHSPHPLADWRVMVKSGQYPAVVHSVKVLWESVREKTLHGGLSGP